MTPETFLLRSRSRQGCTKWNWTFIQYSTVGSIQGSRAREGNIGLQSRKKEKKPSQFADGMIFKTKSSKEPKKNS